MKFNLTTEELNAVLDYESFLREQKTDKKISAIYFKGTDEENDRRARHILQYVFINILRWTPEDVLNRASKEMLTELQLTIPYSKLIYPRELSKKRDYFYMAKLLFPESIKSLSRRDMIIHFYQQVLNRTIAMPSDYFNDEEGEYKAELCLRYYLSRSVQFKNLNELYTFFNDNKEAMKYLKTARLDKVCDLYFETPLDYLDASLPAAQADSLLYFDFKFKEAFKGTEAEKEWKEGLKEGCMA